MAWQSAADEQERRSVIDQIVRLLLQYKKNGSDGQPVGSGAAGVAGAAAGAGGSSGGAAGAAAGAGQNGDTRNKLIRLAQRLEAYLYKTAASKEECTCEWCVVVCVCVYVCVCVCGVPLYLCTYCLCGVVWFAVCGVWHVTYDVWHMLHGVWRIPYGVWRIAYGVWRTAYGIPGEHVPAHLPPI